MEDYPKSLLEFQVDAAGNANRSCGEKGTQRRKSFAFRLGQIIENTICCDRWSQVDTPVIQILHQIVFTQHYFI